MWFATSNVHKFEEARFVLAEFGLAPSRLGAKGAELQSDDVTVIAANAASETFSKYRRPIFVEDTGLFVNCLNGFPGTYASFVHRTIGLAGVLELLSSSKDRSAEFVSAVAYAQSTAGPRVFVGRLLGRIARDPRGSNGFGFDPIFVPEDSVLSLAEMSLEAKCAVSHRTRALRAMGEWLISRRRG